MAANPKLRSLAGILGYGPLNKLRDAGPAFSSFRNFSYDKNVEEQVRPVVLPDHVIDAETKPDKFWGPHPTTGVFGPLDQNIKADSGGQNSANSEPSVLDQKAWFRPLEDVEKPPPA